MVTGRRSLLRRPARVPLGGQQLPLLARPGSYGEPASSESGFCSTRALRPESINERPGVLAHPGGGAVLREFGRTGWTLTLHDGSVTANILTTGDYSNSSFTLAPDSGTGTL
jgi:hypothetical protein